MRKMEGDPRICNRETSGTRTTTAGNGAPIAAGGGAPWARISYKMGEPRAG